MWLAGQDDEKRVFAAQSIVDPSNCEEPLMSSAAVSSTSLNQTQQYFHTRLTDLQSLGKDLGTGDLAAAKTEYQDIVKLGQSGPFASGNAFANPQREQDFAAIGQALQSGNLAAAQQAFSQLKATFEKGGPVPVSANPPDPATPAPKVPGASSNSNSGPEIVLNLGSASGSASPEQITISITNPGSGGEQVSIGVGTQGSSRQQVTLNLGANSKEEIILNFLGASASTSGSSSGTTGSSSTAGLSVTA